jgi:hypothetical protein
MHAGVGLKFGKMNYPFGNIELHFPVITFGENRVNSFATFQGIGFRILTTLQIPIAKKYKLEYTVID